jgi:hypothetical protein
MGFSIVAHYLSIEWLEPGRTRGVEVAPEPIDLECGPDGTLTIETQIFHDMHPWLGLRLSGALAHAKPAFITAQGERHPMLAVDGSDGGVWWVQNDGWDAERKRHFSELHRTMGRFEIAIDSQRLLVENVATGLGRAQIEEYLRDFQQDLIWLVMGFGTATTTGGPPSVNNELIAALTAFSFAARRVIANPAGSLRETALETRIARLRPNAATFRQYARMPTAQRLVGRGTEETADIADNRYLRHMVQVCERLSRNVAQSAQRQADSYKARGASEAARSAEYLSMDSRAVIPEIFDRQQAELKEKLDLVASYTDGENLDRLGHVQRISLKVGKPYGKGADQLFCYRIGGRTEEDRHLGLRYNVLRVPKALARLMLTVLGFNKEYKLRGVVEIQDGKPNKDARLISFSHVVSVTPDMRALARKQRKREDLKQNGWRARLSSREREEMRQEARTAKLRGGVYQKRAQDAAAATIGLLAAQTELHRQDGLWGNIGVAPSPLFPTGMRYSRRPDYAACLSAFCRIRELAEPSGVGDSALVAIDRIGILHASAVYERWCLIKLISVIIEDYAFLPEKGWQDRLIHAVTGLPESLVLDFSRSDIGMIARLEIQPVLPNGRRPDLRLCFRSKLSSLGESGIVMDAKFRTVWRRGELASLLDELVSVKGYGQKRDRVFILQPAANTVTRATSPLDWGRDCDYGHDPKTNHSKGVIHLAPGKGADSPVAHLRRLIALALQSAFPVPRETEPGSDLWESNSFCIRCGKKHAIGDNVRHKRTKGSNDYWGLHCDSCKMLTTRTHCFGCEKPLFKNGIHLTYHRTLADQITNVVCPSCGEYFDPDWREDADAFR